MVSKQGKANRSEKCFKNVIRMYRINLIILFTSKISGNKRKSFKKKKYVNKQLMRTTKKVKLFAYYPVEQLN